MTSFIAVRDLIEERCGLRFDNSQRGSLSASVSLRMQQLGLDSEAEYVERLRGEAPRMVEIVVEYSAGRTAAWTDIPPLTGTDEELAQQLLRYDGLVDYVMVWLEPNDLSGIERFAKTLQRVRNTAP